MKSMTSVKMLTAVALVVGLAACSKQAEKPVEAPATPAVEAPAPAPAAEAPAAEAPVQAVVGEGASVTAPTGEASVEAVGGETVPTAPVEGVVAPAEAVKPEAVVTETATESVGQKVEGEIKKVGEELKKEVEAVK